MPDRALLIQILVVALQYSLLFLLYFFLYHILKVIFFDLRDIHNDRMPFLSRKAKPQPKLMIIASGSFNADQTCFPVGDTLNIGRGEHNDIIINETTVSHEHACITRYNDKYLLSDLHSTNGTYHNDVLVNDDVVLKHGDMIQIGSTTLRFEG